MFWIKFGIKNTSTQPWILRVKTKLVDKFELYEIAADGKISKKVTGDSYLHKDREFDLPDFAFKISIIYKLVFCVWLLGPFVK
jgi:hypothetical protein